jgi:hypothetical protein
MLKLKTGILAQVIEHLTSKWEVLGSSSSTSGEEGETHTYTQSQMVQNACNPNIKESEAGGSRVQV